LDKKFRHTFKLAETKAPPVVKKKKKKGLHVGWWAPARTPPGRSVQPSGA